MYSHKDKSQAPCCGILSLDQVGLFLGRLVSYIRYLTASRPLLLFCFSEGGLHKTSRDNKL